MSGFCNGLVKGKGRVNENRPWLEQCRRQAEKGLKIPVQAVAVGSEKKVEEVRKEGKVGSTKGSKGHL